MENITICIPYKLLYQQMHQQIILRAIEKRWDCSRTRREHLTLNKAAFSVVSCPTIDSTETQTHIEPRWQETVDVCCLPVLIYAGLC